MSNEFENTSQEALDNIDLRGEEVRIMAAKIEKVFGKGSIRCTILKGRWYAQYGEKSIECTPSFGNIDSLFDYSQVVDKGILSNKGTM